jgi:hypothetical protein
VSAAAARWLAACVLTCLSARPAAAADRPRLGVDVDDCVGVPASAVRRDVAVELDALLVEAREGQSVDTTRVAITCADRFVRVTVEDPLSGKVLSRRIDLAREAPGGRVRLLALSAIELVAASWIELEMSDAPPAAAVDATASAAARRSAAVSVARLAPAPDAPSAWHVGAAATVRGFTQPSTHDFGAQLSLQRAFSRNLGVAADASLEGGAAAVDLGRVSALLASAGLAAVMRADLGRWGLQAGLGGRLGLVRLSGTPDQGSPEVTGLSAVRPWAGPFVGTRLHVRVGAGWLATAGTEVGLVALPVDGIVGGLPQVFLRGFWLSGSLGVERGLP